jgi:peptidoglycan L-alanyl-D-glutamate endopeptidase CwlK
MPSRSLDDLHPVFQPYARAFKAACEVAGLDVLIYCTRRSNAEQAELYAQGRTVPGKRVTNAKPGSSAHNFGLALDGVPLFHGKPMWSTAGAGADLWRQYGELALSAGCEWAGNWTRFREFPHVQMPNWRDYT